MNPAWRQAIWIVAGIIIMWLFGLAMSEWQAEQRHPIQKPHVAVEQPQPASAPEEQQQVDVRYWKIKHRDPFKRIK